MEARSMEKLKEGVSSHPFKWRQLKSNVRGKYPIKARVFPPFIETMYCLTQVNAHYFRSFWRCFDECRWPCAVYKYYRLYFNVSLRPILRFSAGPHHPCATSQKCWGFSFPGMTSLKCCFWAFSLDAALLSTGVRKVKWNDLHVYHSAISGLVASRH